MQLSVKGHRKNSKAIVTVYTAIAFISLFLNENIKLDSITYIYLYIAEWVKGKRDVGLLVLLFLYSCNTYTLHLYNNL